MRTRPIEYEHAGVQLRGQLALPPGPGTFPGVLVAHDWSGRNPMAERVAGELAGRGYVGFAIDMYGGGRQGATTEEKAALMGPLRADRSLVMGRMRAALASLRAQPEVDASRVAAIGFCFGGMCVLDLARSGEDVTGVVSFHGLLDAPSSELCAPITARVLVLHGHADPMVKPALRQAFEQELSDAGANWELHAYGHTLHAFTNPAANAPASGTVYDEDVARRAFRSMYAFFDDIF